MVFRKISKSKIYNRKGKLNKQGEAPLEIRLYQKGSSPKYKTILYLAPQFWDKKEKQVSLDHPNYFKYNQIISDTLQKMRDYENTVINRHGSCHVERLLSEYNRPALDLPKSFTAFYRQELLLIKAKKAQETYNNYYYSFKKLIEYQETVYFEDLSFDFVDRYQAFLKNKKLNNRTTNKEVSLLRTIVYSALRKEYIERNPFTHYKPLNESEPPRVFLNPFEIAKWEAMEFEPHEKTLEWKRDIFLLMVYTGLRYCDIVRLKEKEHIHQTENGLVIKIQLKKTGAMSSIPLHSLFPQKEEGPTRAERLVVKLIQYNHDKWSHIKNRSDNPFIDITNHVLNRYFKRLARRVGINKNLPCHCGTRSFCTYLHLAGVPREEIQKLRSHKSPDMTSIYIRLTDKSVIDKLDKANWWD